MNSFFNAIYQQDYYVPVVHSYYDRADMMQTTTDLVNHAHSLCEIMYVNEGQMTIEVKDAVACVGRKQFIWIDANVRHKNLRFAEGLCSMMNIEYQYEALDTRAPSLAALARSSACVAGMLSSPVDYMVLTDRNDTVFRLLKEIIQLADSTHKQSEQLCSMLCTQVVMEVARLSQHQRSVMPPITNRYVSEALTIMQNDYAEPLSAAIIANRLHIQPTYLHRLFRDHTASTMGDQLQRIRVKQAQQLLRTTDDAVADVAAAVGVGSAQSLSQLFRRIVGMSPTEYRKQYQFENDESSNQNKQEE